MQRAEYLKIRQSLRFDKKLSQLLLHLVTDLSLVTTGVLLVQNGMPWLTSPLIAILMFRGFGLMHDASHGAVHGNRRVNDLIGILAGMLTLLPFEPWKKSHLQHHFWSGNVEKDPVMALRTNLPRLPRALTKSLSLLWRCWLPALGFLQNLLFWQLSLKLWPSDRNWKMTLSLVLPLLAWGLLFAFSSTAMIWTAIVPGLAMYYLLAEIVNLPHHLQLPTVRGDERFAIWDQYHTARSCEYPRWFAHFVVLNFNYHAEHHMYPDVPWYHLPELSQKLRAPLGEDYQYDHNMSWILANRGLPLLDVINSDGHRPISKTSSQQSNENSVA